jgi:predicted DCC family thiol-disulfide oxidoreductase YuxK
VAGRVLKPQRAIRQAVSHAATRGRLASGAITGYAGSASRVGCVEPGPGDSGSHRRVNFAAPPPPCLLDSESTASMPDALMVFDGVCNFCSGYVRLVSLLDQDGVIHFTAIQSPYGRQLAGQRGVDPDDPATFLFFDRGEALEGTDAMAAMLARLRPPWRWLRLVKLIPRPLRDAVYRWTARNRYKLLGKRRACIVPSPALRSRFHDTPPAPR